MDFNVRDYMAKGFIKKQELRAQGPRQFTINAVEEAEGLPSRDGKPPRKELVLVSTKAEKFGLRARINQDTMADLHGERTSGWIGKTITLFFDPNVQNPFGGEQGGIRIQRPDTYEADEVETYVSDLEEPPAKGNGAEVPRAKRPAAGSGRARTGRPGNDVA